MQSEPLTHLTVKSRTIAVRLISMAMTGYYKTLIRPRTHRPLSMLKYDPVGTVDPYSEGRETGNNIEGDISR